MLPRDHLRAPTGAQMLYISTAQREHVKWLELPELVERVQATDGCTAEEAREQIRAALRDGAISPLNWEPLPDIIPSYGRGVQLPEGPPGANVHWLTVKIDWECSRVFDTFASAKRKLLLRKLRRDGDWPPPRLSPPRRSVWRHLTLGRESCGSVWPTPQPPNAEHQTPWPADKEHISIKEAAALLEPYCPPGPLVQRYEAIANERAKQLDEARRSTETQREFLQKIASFNHDFDAWRNASVIDKNENDDPTIAVNVAETLRQSRLPSYILLVAESHGVQLIDPLSGLYTVEPDEESWIDKDGFEKIWNVLLQHGKRATLPVVYPKPEPEPEGTVIEVNSSGTPSRKGRLLYVPHLNDWLAPQRLELLLRVGADAKAKEFASYCREEKPEVIPLLPKRWRSMVPAVDRHIKSRPRRSRPR